MGSETRTAPEELKAWRLESGLSQEEAGDRIGVSAPTWCDWERGNKIPRADKIEAIEVLTGRRVRLADWAQEARIKYARASGGCE